MVSQPPALSCFAPAQDMMAHDNPHNLQLSDVTSKDYITLPAETIYHILRYLDPRDLIRLQTVRLSRSLPSVSQP